MAATCLQFLSFVMSALGWFGILIATSTNSWVQTCSHGAASCRRFDELGSYGLWTECFTSFGIYHCKNLANILEIAAYVQISRALMITASILGLPAILLVLTALPCMHLGSEAESVKHKRSLLGAVLLLCVALCTAVATIWFPVGVHHEKHLYNFGYSLFAGWIGTALCFFGGAVISCCTGTATDRTENRYYYSSQGSSTNISPTHAKSVHI